MGCRVFLLVLLLVFSMGSAFSQALLTPEEAIDIALENSFGVLVARNNADIATDQQYHRRCRHAAQYYSQWQCQFFAEQC